MPDATIGPLTEDHAEAYSALRSSFTSKDIAPLLPEHASIVLQQYSEDQMLAIGYWLGDKLVGACLCTLYVTFTKIELVLVHPDYRHQGIGTKLIEKIAEIDCLEGFGRVSLYCSVKDQRLMDWYKSLGFQVTAINTAGYCVMTRLPMPRSTSDLSL